MAAPSVAVSQPAEGAAEPLQEEGLCFLLGFSEGSAPTKSCDQQCWREGNGFRSPPWMGLQGVTQIPSTWFPAAIHLHLRLKRHALLAGLRAMGSPAVSQPALDSGFDGPECFPVWMSAPFLSHP